MAMVAIDQRESLRAMFAKVTEGPVPDQTLADFKEASARVLRDDASAILLDRLYGIPAVDRVLERGDDCALIVALDELIGSDGSPPTTTAIDASLTAADARELGARAAKLLVLWSAETEGYCLQLAGRFNEDCRSAGVLSLVEAIVRPGQTTGRAFDHEGEIVRAAAALNTTRPDLYKCEVPFHGGAKDDAIRAVSERITAVLDCPWVVLSNGVAGERFPAAVEQCCRGGASGFLAGRAVWADTIDGGDYRRGLAERSVPRLRRLGAIVDEHARPWYRVTGI
jgi:sulfofructosephosphate aldolase